MYTIDPAGQLPKFPRCAPVRNYPFKDMKVGESFYIDEPKTDRMRTAVSVAMTRAKHKLGWRFMAEWGELGTRVWRVE